MTIEEERVESCCAVLYGEPLLEVLAGESLHPGGLPTTRRLLEAAHVAAGDRLLDAGCGLGASARLAAVEFGLSVDGCDVSPAAIGRARTLAAAAGADVRFADASVLALPYPDSAFSAVIVECVLSTTSKAAALRELGRVLQPGGHLLVSDVTADGAVAAPEPLASVLCMTRAWLPGELEDELASAGMQVERSWDESPTVAQLLDRIEARARLLGAIARDAVRLPWPVADLGERLGLPADRASQLALLDEARRLVRAGAIGYRAVVARAVRPKHAHGAIRPTAGTPGCAMRELRHGRGRPRSARA